MRQLPVLLLVVAALGIFYLAFFGGDAPVTAPILPPAGPNGPAVTVQDDGPVDLQRPTQDDGLAEVAAAVDRQRVDTPHAILANSVSGRVVAGGKGVQGATVTLTKFGRLASLFGPVTGNQREEDRVEETNENGEFVFRNVETYTELSLIAKHPKLGRKEEGNIQIAEGEARKGPVIILGRSEEHTSELQSRRNLVCRLLLEKKKQTPTPHTVLIADSTSRHLSLRTQ